MLLHMQQTSDARPARDTAQADAIRRFLSRGGLIDITTTGRKTGDPRRIVGRNADVDARPANRLLGGELQVGLFQRGDGVLHGENLLDFLVVDDERHGPAYLSVSVRKLPVMKSPSAAVLRYHDIGGIFGNFASAGFM